MIIGVGIDVVQTDRIARMLAGQGERFEELVFTPEEVAACAGRADRVQALAARLAGKEAFLKALGTGWISGVSLRQVEVTRQNGGPPDIRLCGGAAERARERGVARVHLSLSHEQDYAAAVVILESSPT